MWSRALQYQRRTGALSGVSSAGMLAYPGWSGEGDHFIGKGSNQIEYEDEDPEIRAAFEAELAKNGLQSKMRPELYVKNAGKYKRLSRSAVGNCLLLLIS
jgi:hypothetical protein